MNNTIESISSYIGSGSTPLKSNQLFWNSKDIPWLKTEQLGEFRINKTNEFISNKAFKDCNLKLYPKNTLSIAMYGEGKTRGNVSIINTPMTTNQACCNVIVDAQKANYLYVYYWLKNCYEELRSLSSGVRKNLNSQDIKTFKIDLKSRSEQDLIADFLFNIDLLIEKNTKIINELNHYLKRVYEYIFVQFEEKLDSQLIIDENTKIKKPEGWNIISLRELVEKENEPFNNKGYNDCIDLSVMKSDSIILTKLNDSANFDSNLYKLKKGNILFGSIRTYLHKMGIAPVDGAVTGTVYSFRVKDEKYYNLVLALMSHSSFFDYTMKMSKGTRMPVVSVDDILDYKLAISDDKVEQFNKIKIKEMIINLSEEIIKLNDIKKIYMKLLMGNQIRLYNNDK